MPSDILRIAFVPPGWAASGFSNGIIPHIENLIPAFENTVLSYVLAHSVVNGCAGEKVIDLSEFGNNRSLVESLIDRLLRLSSAPGMNNLKFQRRWAISGRRIIKGINSLDSKLDLVEVEESFGMGKTLVDETDIPIVTRLHGPWFIHGPIMKRDRESVYQPRVLAEGHAIKCSHGITSPSLDVLNRVREYYDCELTNAKVIPVPVPPVPEDLHWQINSKARPSILFVGRFDLHKGGDLAIAAFRIIARQNKDVELLFVGPDRGVSIGEEHYSVQKYIETFVPEDSVRSRIAVLGQCNGERITHLRRKSLVTIMTSRYENFPMSLLEALSAGCPVVATSVGGVPEIIEHGYNGMIAESEKPESIAEQVLSLISDQELMNSLSSNAKQHCSENYHPEKVATEILHYYHNVIARQG